jgi:hypothetical protein
MNLTGIYDSRREDVTDLKMMDADLEASAEQAWKPLEIDGNSLRITH